MKHLFANPTVRLAARALVAGGIAALTLYHSSGGTIAWKSLAVAAGLAFCEIFTPLNSIVGVFKGPTKQVGGYLAAPPVSALASRRDLDDDRLVASPVDRRGYEDARAEDRNREDKRGNPHSG